MNRQIDIFGKPHHSPVMVRQAPANIDDQQQPAQTAAHLKIPGQQFAPMLPHRFGYPRETVAGQIHESLFLAKAEKIDELGPTWRLAGARKLPAIDDDIDRTRLAAIGAAGHRDLDARVWRKLIEGIGALDKTGIWELRHGDMPKNLRV